jgi:Bacterial Ig-like domain (group 3)
MRRSKKARIKRPLKRKERPAGALLKKRPFGLRLFGRGSMAIESADVFRRVARTARLVLTAGLIPAGMAAGQLPIQAPAPVTVGSVIPFNHGSTGLWGQIYSSRIAPNGNILFLDSAQSEIYQVAPGASEPTLVVGAAPQNTASNCSTLEASGTYWNAAIAFDSQNNMYVTDRYGSAVQFCRVPYDASSGKWVFSASDIWAGPTVMSNGTPTPVMPQDLDVGDDGTFYVSWSTQGEIDKFSVNASSGAVTNVTRIITGLEQLAANVVVDHAGNLFFIENIYGSTLGTRVPGIYEIPAGTTGLTGNGSGSIEQTLKRIDPSGGGYDGISGLTFDSQGNLYFTSINNSSYNGNVAGVFMIPNEGTPTAPNLNWSDTVMVAPVYAGHPVLVDPRGYLWIPTGGSGNWSLPGTIAPNCDSTSTATVDATCLYSTIVMWKPGTANVGPAAVGAGGASAITAYSAPAGGGSITLTASNSFTEDEMVTITAPSGDALSALNGLSFYVSGSGLSNKSFEISTGLVTGSGTTAATASPAGIATLYYSFSQATTPESIAFGQVGTSKFTAVANPTPDTTVTPAVPPCTAGTAYPAFSSTETGISTYSWCQLFVKMTPTAAGQAGSEVQMLDASSDIISGSNAYVTGLGQAAAVSNLATPAMQSIASGLSSPEQVAADVLGNTYVADSGLKAVEIFPAGTTSATGGKAIGSGLSGPTGVAVDGAGNVYIGDGGKVIEIPYINGQLVAADQTTIASGLGSQLNLATDSQGDVFVADKTNKQVVEVPNPQSALMLENEPAIQLGAGAAFNGPSAIAADSAGNAWVADGNDLWEITMPFGGATEVLTGLQGPVTGLGVDPSGSVFVTDAAGLVWVPSQASSGEPNINFLLQVAAGFGTTGTVLPTGVAVDGQQNVYAIYGSSSTAGMAQVGIGGSIDFNNYGEINPNVPFEHDAQLFNLGNTPLTLTTFTSDVISGANASDYSVGAAGSFPQCGPGTDTAPGGSCYLGLTIQAPAAGQANASVAVMSNAVNAAAGLNIAMATNVIQDLRPGSSTAVSVTPASGVIYPGAVTVTVTVTSSTGTPVTVGKVVLAGSSANGTLPAQNPQTVNANGVATFSYTGLLGGAYSINATYTGEGTAGATQNTCSSSTPACYAGSAAKGTFVVAPAKPTFTVAAPVGSTANLTVYNGGTFLSESATDSITATVVSSVGTPTGTVTFCLTYTSGTCTPADATQGVNGAIPLSGQGQASFSTNNLPIGTYNLTALYSGDVNYAQQAIALPAFQVIVPSVEITSSPTTATITPGTPTQATLTLMPLVGFSSDGVFVECVTATLPPYSECTFNNPEVSVSGGPSTIVVTISTNVPVNGGTTASIARQAPWSLAGLFGLGLLGLIAGRKRMNRYLAMLCLACMFSGLFVGITACTNAGYSTPPPAPKVTTPTGTYNVQIITYNPANQQQNSLSSPAFVLPTTVQ